MHIMQDPLKSHSACDHSSSLTSFFSELWTHEPLKHNLPLRKTWQSWGERINFSKAASLLIIKIKLFWRLGRMEIDSYFKCCINPVRVVLLICHMVCLLSSTERSEDEGTLARTVCRTRYLSLGKAMRHTKIHTCKSVCVCLCASRFKLFFQFSHLLVGLYLE